MTSFTLKILIKKQTFKSVCKNITYFHETFLLYSNHQTCILYLIYGNVNMFFIINNNIIYIPFALII